MEKIEAGTIDWGVKAIKADQFWSKSQGEGVKVAIIDTGIDMDHPDLKDNIKAGINMFDHTENISDDGYHGTHVAGIIAGTGKQGVVGVAPKAELYIAKALDKNGNGSLASVMDGISFGINHEVDILCMSLGVSQELPPILEQKILEAYNRGIVIVGATGNSGIQSVEYPAKYDEVIAVGGARRDLNRADFSSYGWETDIIAPAVDILSTYPDGKYAKVSGTSMASAFVTGGTALLISYHRKLGRELTVSDIKTMIVNGKDRDIYTGFGIFELLYC
ncbi:S8 family peptidase [Thermoactinomyces sp. DSM 45892]|uniref:S8 family peptidase n=1 Tax=Thermoactinomyces sp. DSM 45892 TaxID=1882753 RepID=UPI00089B418C|nr:S8 family peptidase [Thermoactinomyces sp. DSM 45892]SDX93112.1 Subtilase family protein [Thermoactinomyces sp. DSM 45892]